MPLCIAACTRTVLNNLGNLTDVRAPFARYFLRSRQKEFDAGVLPDFLPETKHIRDDPSWRVCNCLFLDISRKCVRFTSRATYELSTLHSEMVVLLNRLEAMFCQKYCEDEAVHRHDILGLYWRVVA